MKIKLDPTTRKFIEDLMNQAFERNQEVDWETLTLRDFPTKYPFVFPQGDRTPEDYEYKEGSNYGGQS